LILAAAAVLCLLMARFAGNSQRDMRGSLTLWYAETDCPQTVMDGFAAVCRGESGIGIRAVAFADEDALGDAFENERPDLIFCSHFRAGSLAERGRLAGVQNSTDAETGEWIGRAFFPIGARLPLLLTNTALADGKIENLEALLSADDTAVLASNDWAELLFTAMYAYGRAMQGIPEADREDGVYRRLYNTLAEAAFRGALVLTGEATVDYVRQGLVPYAVVRSTEVAGLRDEKLSVSLLPLPKDAQLLYPAELMGFAVLEGNDAGSTEIFLSWLSGGTQGAAASLAAGLVPLNTSVSGKSAIEKTLVEIAKSGELRYPTMDTVFYDRRAACERQLQEALDLLSAAVIY
jgi:hypothetical protein